ncbi:MAG: hypothetical protein RR847_05305, partial [Bacilli bacterium]
KMLFCHATFRHYVLTIVTIKEICSLIGIKKNDIINKTYWDIQNSNSKKNKDIKFSKDHVFLLGSFID